VEDLERVGAALELCGQGDFAGARRILDDLEEVAVFPTELPCAEFYYLLGLCRARTGDHGGSFEALEKALAIDPEFLPALAERDRLLEGEAPR
jgi:Tfp pilus assembly protein PilF